MPSRRRFGKAAGTALLGVAIPRKGLTETIAGFMVNALNPLPPSSTLPEALTFPSGYGVRTHTDWALRRKQILRTAELQMYGTTPTSTGLRFEMLERDGNAFDGTARRTQVRLHFHSERGSPSATLLLYAPKNVGRAPVIVGLNFWGNHTLSDDPKVLLPSSWVESGNNPYVDLRCVENHRATEGCRGIDSIRWPVRKILERGYALCTLYRGDIDPDLADGRVPGLRDAFPSLEVPGDNFGTIGAWAWTLSRMLDYLQTDPTVDAQRAAVYGWSRLGKAAVWAGACDSRFAAVLSQESGAGGAKLFRHGAGEDIHRLNTTFPHWFCKNFRAYNGMDKELPFDQHLVLSAIAPRPLFVASAAQDTFSDPAGEFAATVLASEVYQFLGAGGLPSVSMPPPGSPLFGTVSYQVRDGGHDVTDYDWEQHLYFLDKVLPRRANRKLRKGRPYA